MSTQHHTPENNSDSLPEPLRQDATQHVLLGVDLEGYHHVLVDTRDKIVVINHEGIDVQVDLADHPDKDEWTWMEYVDQTRGWKKRQRINLHGIFQEVL
ncbi:hypothetical protein ACFQH6_20635 [Halobacteriaceae archaeon GCM10025711]